MVKLFDNCTNCNRHTKCESIIEHQATFFFLPCFFTILIVFECVAAFFLRDFKKLLKSSSSFGEGFVFRKTIS